jgi:hypothetical protein
MRQMHYVFERKMSSGPPFLRSATVAHDRVNGERRLETKTSVDVDDGPRCENQANTETWLSHSR